MVCTHFIYTYIYESRISSPSDCPSLHHPLPLPHPSPPATPRLLIQPTTGLDPANRRRVWKVLQEQKKTSTIIMTTHSMEEADLLADSIAVMSKVLPCVAVGCNMLQCVAVCCSLSRFVAGCCWVLQCVAVCCSVLQCVAVCCSVLQCVVLSRSEKDALVFDVCLLCVFLWQCVAVYCSVLQCCSALQCVAVCCSVC